MSSSPTLFAIVASAQLLEATEQLFDREYTASDAELHGRIRDGAYLYVDGVIDGLVLGFIDEEKTSSGTKTLLRNLAGVIKTVSHGLIRQAFGSASRAEMHKLVGYLRDRIQVVRIHEQPTGAIVFPLAPENVAEFRTCFAASREGRATTMRAEYTGAMLRFIDDGLYHYFELPFSMLELGFVTRRAVALGRSTIHAGSHAAIKRSIASDTEDELRHLTEWLDPRFVAA